MGCLVPDEHMRMVGDSTNHDWLSPESTNNPAKIFVGLVDYFFVQGWISVFRAENIVVMEAVVCRWHLMQMLSRTFLRHPPGSEYFAGSSRGLRS